MMKRREFMTLLGGAALVPLRVRAQEPGRTYRLGFLIPAGRDTPAIAGFLDELRLNGFIEGQNLTVIWGDFNVPTNELAERAAALVKAAPDAIVAGPELPLRTLQAATQTVPLIGMTEDMVASGLVASLARPGGNTTGISLLSPELDGKRQDILIEAVPGVQRIAALADSNVTPPRHVQTLQEAARAHGVQLSVFGVGGPEEIVSAINAAKTSGAEALNFLATPLFAIPASSSNASRNCICPPFINGPKRRNRAASPRTARVSFKFTVNVRGWWSRCCAASNPPIFPSNSRLALSW